MSRTWLAVLALALAAASLAINLVLIWEVRHPARLLGPALSHLAGASLDSAGVLHYDVRIPAGTPLNIDIPVSERFDVAVDTVIPLRTTLRVPIRGPLGVAYVHVPIDAKVPLRTRLPLNIRHTFRLRTKTSEPISVPLQIRLKGEW